MEEISLKEIIFLLNKHRKLIIVITIIGLFLSLGYSLIKDYEYESFTTLMLQRPQSEESPEIVNETQELQKEQKFVATCIDILRSRTLYDELIRNLEIEDLEYKDYQKNVSVYQTSSAPIIRINVKDKDPKLAASIANELSTLFINNAGRYVEIESISLIDKAVVPNEPIEKNTLLSVVIGAILGMMIGVFGSFAFEYFDDTVKTPMDVKNYFDLKVVGAIPYYSPEKSNKKIYDKQIDSFRILRTNVKNKINDEVKTFAVTSSQQSEGKTHVAINLAKSFAAIGDRVLLVDCNFRHPSLFKELNIKNNAGLVEILKNEADLNDLILNNKVDENLYVISTGEVEDIDIELINSDNILSFVDKVKDDFDRIIFDTPASGVVSEGLEIASICDETILVIGIDETKIDTVNHTIELLKGVNADIIGVVLNKIPMEKEQFYGYSYLYNDGYYSF